MDCASGPDGPPSAGMMPTDLVLSTLLEGPNTLPSPTVLRMANIPIDYRAHSHRLAVATRHRRGSHTLPQRPSVHATPTTPAGFGGFNGRLLLRRAAAFPLWQEGRLQQVTFGAFSGFTRVAACTFAHWTYSSCSGGFSRTVTRIDCSGGYRGVPTTPRAGLSPVGLRDPEVSYLCLSIRSSDSSFVSHCHPKKVDAERIFPAAHAP